jgi:hypothetical protein
MEPMKWSGPEAMSSQVVRRVLAGVEDHCQLPTPLGQELTPCPGARLGKASKGRPSRKIAVRALVSPVSPSPARRSL